MAPKSANHLLGVFLTTVAAAGLCSACFVVRREQFGKPLGPAEAVKFHRIAAGCETYSRLVNSTELTAEVSVANWPSGWELQFLLNVIPISRYHYGKTEALSVELSVEPKTPGLTLDPGHVFFIGEGQLRLAPTNAWVIGSLQQRTSVNGAVPITNCAIFHLDFPVEHRAYPEHDLPFQLFIEGLSVAGRGVPVAPITFASETTTRPGFRLPY